MGHQNIHVMTCDRCGKTEEDRTGTACYAWGEIAARQINGPFQIGDLTNRKSRDICPDCRRSLGEWWSKPRSPTPPPEPHP